MTGWGARIRTWEWWNQNPLPYHLATPHRDDGATLPAKPESRNRAGPKEQGGEVRLTSG
jgi:hypothetical protein